MVLSLPLSVRSLSESCAKPKQFLRNFLRIVCDFTMRRRLVKRDKASCGMVNCVLFGWCFTNLRILVFTSS